MVRRNMRKVAAAFVSLCVVSSMFMSTTFAASASDFSDINGSTAKAALVKAVENGLLNGNNGKIQPNDPLKRAEMAAIINRAFAATEKASLSNFTDVAAGKWYVDDLAKAVKMGTFTGSGTSLAPEKAISRQDTFVVIARAFKLTKTDLSSLNKFSDKDQISSYARESIAALASLGYVAGSKGKLNPTADITRAEFATIMDRMVSVYFNKAGTYSTLAKGNVMVNTGSVILKNVIVTGDLILGDGIGKGDVTLDGVKVAGRTVVRGGGANSIHVINGSSLTGTVIIDNVNNQVRIVTDKGTTIQNIEAGSQVILEGSFGNVSVIGDSNSSLEIKGDVKTLTIESKAAIKLTSGTIATVDIKSTAANTTVDVAKDAKIDNITAEAKTDIKGEGTVTKVEAKANDINVDTKGTEVKVDKGITGVKAGGKEVTASDTTNPAPTPTPAPVPGGTAPTTPTTPTTPSASISSVSVTGTNVSATYSGGTVAVSVPDPSSPNSISSVTINAVGATSLVLKSIGGFPISRTFTFTSGSTSISVQDLLAGFTTKTSVSIQTLKSTLGSQVTVIGDLVADASHTSLTNASFTISLPSNVTSVNLSTFVSVSKSGSTFNVNVLDGTLDVGTTGIAAILAVVLGDAASELGQVSIRNSSTWRNLSDTNTIKGDVLALTGKSSGSQVKLTDLKSKTIYYRKTSSSSAYTINII